MKTAIEDIGGSTADVSVGSKASVCLVASYFRSAPTSGHRQTSPACLVGANTRTSTSRLSGFQIPAKPTRRTSCTPALPMPSTYLATTPALHPPFPPTPPPEPPPSRPLPPSPHPPT